MEAHRPSSLPGPRVLSASPALEWAGLHREAAAHRHDGRSVWRADTDDETRRVALRLGLALDEPTRVLPRDALPACACTSADAPTSNGVDVRPWAGCDTFGEEGIAPYCYVASGDDAGCGGQASARFPGAVYRACTASPPPPPVEAACADPLFPTQWHLRASRAVDAWASWRAGSASVASRWAGNVSVVVVDTGVDTSHPDLVVEEAVAWDEETGAVVPAGEGTALGLSHGTACAGVVGAVDDNGVGGCGVAPGAALRSAGLLRPSGVVFDSEMADSVEHFLASADVYTNSWGPPDDFRSYSVGPLFAAALERATTEGRGGRGAVVVWASGNGGPASSVNDDPYASHPSVLAVAAVGPHGKRTSYSEPGGSIFLSAPSYAGTHGIVTTDPVGVAGYDAGDHTDSFSGTSAATPVVAGAAALLLSRRADLTWRDVQQLLASTASRNDPDDPAWTTNAAGVDSHPFYGFGLVDAGAAVAAADGWTLVGEEVAVEADVPLPTGSPSPIPDDGSEWVASVSLPADLRVERALLSVDASHTFRGHLAVSLVSPAGTACALTNPFGQLPAGSSVTPADLAFVPRTFLCHSFFGEGSGGEWTVRVADLDAGAAGRVLSLRLALRGTASPPAPSAPAPPAPSAPAPPSAHCPLLRLAYAAACE
jgi:subtilisin-like proprotein convertase family protein